MRALAVSAVVVAALLSAACGSEDETSAATATAPVGLQTEAAGQTSGKSVTGLLTAMEPTLVTLRTPEGVRTFVIRNEDREAIGFDHMESHVGAPVGFEVFYEAGTGDEEGVEFIVGAREAQAPEGLSPE